MAHSGVRLPVLTSQSPWLARDSGVCGQHVGAGRIGVTASRRIRSTIEAVLAWGSASSPLIAWSRTAAWRGVLSKLSLGVSNLQQASERVVLVIPLVIVVSSWRKKLWTEDEPEHKGSYYRFPPLRFHPAPVQKPGPPILLGGGSKWVFSRVAVWADGWAPWMISPEDLAAGRRELDRECERVGRDPRQRR